MVQKSTNLKIRALLGTASFDFSSHRRYIATLGAGLGQSLKIWEWTLQKDEPAAQSEVRPPLPSEMEHIISVYVVHLVIYDSR